MGLDITISKGTKKYWRFEDKFKNDPRMIKVQAAVEAEWARQEKEGINRSDEYADPKSSYRKALDERDKVEAIVDSELNPGYEELYFRKVPRVIPSILMQVEKERGLTLGSLVGSANSMDKEDELIYSGTLKLKNLRTAVTYMTMEKMGGMKGFFWGEDSWTKDEEIKESFDEFFNRLKGVSEDEEISYSFSW